MLSYEEIGKLRGFLEKGQIAEAKKYLDEEEQRIYIKEAVAAMMYYSKRNFPNCGYRLLSGDQLLLSTKCSLFKLYSQDLYHVYSGAVDRKYEPLREIGDIPNCPKEFNPKAQYLDWIDGPIDEKYVEVDSKKLEEDSKDPNKSVYRIKSADDTICVCVKKEIIDFADAILGMDTSYHVEKEQESYYLTLKAQSKRGKGYILSI